MTERLSHDMDKALSGPVACARREQQMAVSLTDPDRSGGIVTGDDILSVGLVGLERNRGVGRAAQFRIQHGHGICSRSCGRSSR